MRFRLHKLPDCQVMPARTWDVALVGTSLDSRGTEGIQGLRHRTRRCLEIAYDCRSLEVSLDGRTHHIDEFNDILAQYAAASVVFEATTLGFAEILLCCKALRLAGVRNLSFCYVEPTGYSSPRRGEVIHRRDFELTDDVEGYIGIPGASYMLNEAEGQTTILFLGFESQRLDQAFEVLPLRPSRCTVVFGVPAYRWGWETDSFANNVRVMGERQIGGGVDFCAADSPRSVYELLSLRRQELGGKGRLFVAPVGSKPHGIGVALFVSEYCDVGVLYDHPRRLLGRTTGSGPCHIYDVEL